MIYNSLFVGEGLPYCSGLSCCIEQLPFFASPDTTNKTAIALAMLNQKKYDVIFWDLRLTNKEDMRALSIAPSCPPIIALSDNPDYALESFDVGAIDFLLTPFSFDRFTKAINRLQNYTISGSSVSDSEMVFLKVGRQMQCFFYKDIICVEALASYTKIVMANKTVVVSETISELSIKLPQNKFTRVHKSYLINLSHINAFDTKIIVVAEHEIPLGMSYRPYFEKYLKLLTK